MTAHARNDDHPSSDTSDAAAIELPPTVSVDLTEFVQVVDDSGDGPARGVTR